MRYDFVTTATVRDCGVLTLAMLSDICAASKARTVMVSDDAFGSVWKQLTDPQKHVDELGVWFWAGTSKVRPESCVESMAWIELDGLVSNV